MKCNSRLFLFVCISVLICSCEKADLKESEKKDPEEPPVEISSDTLSVAQVLFLAENGTEEDLSKIDALGVKGYIVGAIPGTSLSHAVFQPPYNTSSNIIIADNKNERSPDKCMPVRLVKGSPFRVSLNLIDNPLNKGRQILLSGTIKRYFRTFGMYDLNDYVWCGIVTPPDSMHNGNPFLVFDPEIINGGR